MESKKILPEGVWKKQEMLLITEVKQHPPLYEKNGFEKYGTDVYNMSWTEVSRRTGLSDDTCRKTWLQIEQRYAENMLNSQSFSKYSDETLDFLKSKVESMSAGSSTVDSIIRSHRSNTNIRRKVPESESDSDSEIEFLSTEIFDESNNSSDCISSRIIKKRKINEMDKEKTLISQKSKSFVSNNKSFNNLNEEYDPLNGKFKDDQGPKPISTYDDVGEIRIKTKKDPIAMATNIVSTNTSNMNTLNASNTIYNKLRLVRKTLNKDDFFSKTTKTSCDLENIKSNNVATQDMIQSLLKSKTQECSNFVAESTKGFYNKMQNIEPNNVATQDMIQSLLKSKTQECSNFDAESTKGFYKEPNNVAIQDMVQSLLLKKSQEDSLDGDVFMPPIVCVSKKLYSRSISTTPYLVNQFSSETFSLADNNTNREILTNKNNSVTQKKDYKTYINNTNNDTSILISEDDEDTNENTVQFHDSFITTCKKKGTNICVEKVKSVDYFGKKKDVFTYDTNKLIVKHDHTTRSDDIHIHNTPTKKYASVLDINAEENDMNVFFDQLAEYLPNLYPLQTQMDIRTKICDLVRTAELEMLDPKNEKHCDF